MSSTIGGLSAAARDTIAFETGITGGSLNSVNAWNWRTTSTSAAIYGAGGSAHKWGGDTAGSSGGVVTYSFDPGSGFTEAQEQIFTAALTLWSDEANISFVEVSDPATAEVTFSLVGSDSSGLPLDNGAYEYSYYSAGQIGSSIIPTITSANIVMDTADFGEFTSFSDRSGYSISTIVHEIGHLIGLGHAGPYNGTADAATQQYNSTDMRLWTIMSYVPPSDTSAKYAADYTPSYTSWGSTSASTTPQMLDILAAQELYGTSTSTTYSGGQIFGFNSNITDASRIFFDFTVNTDPVVTIWDSGSNNTLDLSGFYTSSTVNLNPGSFSSVDGMTNNIGIAYGTAIDTVIGGYGDDVFIVNQDNDTIDGGAGRNLVVFAGSYASYSVSRESDGTVIVTNGQITDTLKNIQSLEFDDQTVAVSGIPVDQTTLLWTGGGSYDQAASWVDETTGVSASAAPDADDVVVIDGPSSGAPETLSGDGTTGRIAFTGLVGMTGTVTAVAVAVGEGDGASATLTIAPDASLAAGSMAVVNGTLTNSGTLTVTGQLTLEAIGTGATAQLSIAASSRAQVGALELAGGAISMGGLGSYLTVGPGQSASGLTAFTVTEGGELFGYGTIGHAVGGFDDPIIDNGTIIASGGTLALPAVVGSGLMEIAADATLALKYTAAGSAGVTIDFLDDSGTISVGISASAMLGEMENFTPGDVVQLTGSKAPLLQPVYTAGSIADTGVLSVENAYGTQVFSTTLVGDFSDSVFLLLPQADGSEVIVTAEGSLSGSTTPSAGTAGDLFAWDADGSGDWNDPANWVAYEGEVQGAATVAPGQHDDVVIGSPGDGEILVVRGDGNAQALLFEGFEAVSGTVSAGDVVIGQDGDAAALALIGTASLATEQMEVTDSTVYVANGTRLTVAGLLSIGTSSAQSSATLAAYGGGIVQVGTLSLGGGSAPVTIDGSSSLEVGFAGGAQAGMMTVDAGHSIEGFGTLSVAIANAGRVTAEGGTLVVRAAGGSGVYNIGEDATLSVLYQTNAAVLPSFDFTGFGSTLQLNLLTYLNDYSFGTIRDFTYGETIAFASGLGGLPTALTYQSTGVSGGELILSNVNGQRVELTLEGNYQQSEFLLTQTGAGITSLTIACFASGTLIRTLEGEVPVEALQVGDRVVTQSGAVSPIRWVGKRHVNCRQHTNPAAVLPVRVAKDAFGCGLPMRDLYLSPDHAVFAKGVLVPVKHLINGHSITQITVARVTYWHVELPQHDILLAEGLPVESYLDTGDRLSFEAAGVVVALHPLWGAEAGDVALIMEALGYAPLRVAGPEVEALRAELARDDEGGAGAFLADDGALLNRLAARRRPPVMV